MEIHKIEFFEEMLLVRNKKFVTSCRETIKEMEMITKNIIILAMAIITIQYGRFFGF